MDGHMWRSLSARVEISEIFFVCRHLRMCRHLDQRILSFAVHNVCAQALWRPTLIQEQQLNANALRGLPQGRRAVAPVQHLQTDKVLLQRLPEKGLADAQARVQSAGKSCSCTGCWCCWSRG